MLRQHRSPKTSHPMIRSASLLVITGALWAGAAHAQMSGADLVTRIDRLQAQVRELTGTVEELQYRNQQLEQELQRLRAAAPGAPAASSPTAQSAPPPNSRYSSPQYPPAAGGYPQPAAPPPAVVASTPVAAPPPAVASGDANLSTLRHGDAFDPDRNPAAPGAPRPMGASTAANEPPPAAAAFGQSQCHRCDAGRVAAGQYAKGRVRSRLWLRSAQRFRARRADFPRFLAQISKRSAHPGSAILAWREPVPGQAVSRRRGIVSHRFHQI